MTPRSWVIMMIAVPNSCWSRFMTSRTCACTVTSSAVVGSSAMSSFGFNAIAMAIIARCRMPPENWCGKVVDPARRLRNADQPKQVDGPLARGLLGDALVVRTDHLDDLPADPVVRVQARQRVLKDHRDLRAADRLELVGLHREEVLARRTGRGR